MGNIFSRLTGNQINNTSNRNTKSDYNSGYQRRKSAENAVSPQIPPPEPPLHSTPLRDVSEVAQPIPKPKPKPTLLERNVPNREPVVYKTTFETQVDAAPPHPLEEKFNNDILFDEIEIETNLFTPEVEDAVIKIQAGIRGYLARKQVKGLKKDNEEALENNRNVPLLEEIFVAETAIVPPPQHFNDSKHESFEELSKMSEKWNKLIERNDFQALVINSHQEISNNSQQKLETKNSPLIPHINNETKKDISENEINTNDNKSLDNEKENNNNNNKTKETEIELRTNIETKDLENIEFKTNSSEVPLLKTSSEKAVEKLNKSNENISLVKDYFLMSENNSSANDLIENKSSEKVIENIIDLNENKVEECNTKEKTIEEQVVEVIFDGQTNIEDNKVVAIELFKQDISEEELAKVKTINEPETKKPVEDRVYKTSLNQFVVKPVEQKQEVVNTSDSENSTTLLEDAMESVPILEEQKIEFIRSNSRKSLSEEREVSQEVLQVVEVIPNAQPLIQVEEQNGTVLDEEEAAIRIQAAFRGFQIRRSLSREASPNRTSNNHNNDNTDNNQQMQSQLSPDSLLTDNQNHVLVDLSDERPDCGQQNTIASEQRINSLERLENQLMQELISSDDKNDEYLDNILDLNQKTEEKNNLISLEKTNEISEPQEVVKVEEQTYQEIDQVLNDEQNVIQLNETQQSNVNEMPDNLHLEPLIADISPLNTNDNNKVDSIQIPFNNCNEEIISVENNNNERPEKSAEDCEVTKESQISEVIAIDTQLDAFKLNDSNPLIPTSLEKLETKEIPTDIRPEIVSQIQTQVEPPTPAEATQITPQTMFISPEMPVLTKIGSSESEHESVVENNPEKGSKIPIPEPKKKMGLEIPKKKLQGILKDKESHNLCLEEQTQSTSEEISSPDDDPEIVGLGPNTPIPIRASSPNPFGKKRRKGKKSSGRKN